MVLLGIINPNILILSVAFTEIVTAVDESNPPLKPITNPSVFDSSILFLIKLEIVSTVFLDL